MKCAPWISPRLRRELEQLANGSLSAAEITRALGDKAESFGLRRPSYEQVRKLVREHRARPRYPSTAEVLLDVALRMRPHGAIVIHLAGLDQPKPRK